MEYGATRCTPTRTAVPRRRRRDSRYATLRNQLQAAAFLAQSVRRRWLVELIAQCASLRAHQTMPGTDLAYDASVAHEGLVRASEGEDSLGELLTYALAWGCPVLRIAWCYVLCIAAYALAR
eukprot:1361230-Rhodomonas_salina.6